MKIKLKPFVKWVGGKTQLLDVISPLVPKNYHNFIEPFVGSGAIFLNFQPQHLIINDTNKELITTWNVIKDDFISFKKLLEEYQKKHLKSNILFFQKLKNVDPDNISQVEIASRFLYLNKTCFNGLFRVNSQGKFNVPWNQKTKINFDFINAKNVSNYLKELVKVKILNYDFEKVIDEAVSGDFIYLDPPYTSEDNKLFTKYSAKGFTKKDQLRLFESLERATARKVTWVLSNSKTSFIEKMYSKYNKISFLANRLISCNSSKRVDSASEFLIFNFNLSKQQEKELLFALEKRNIVITNRQLNKFFDWNKINQKLTFHRKHLEKLNDLISSSYQEFNFKIDLLYQDFPEAFSVIPLLLAFSEPSKFLWIEENEEVNDWKKLPPLETIKNVISKTGLDKNLFINSQIKSIIPYFLGVKVGLSTNLRKNISGKIMEEKVERILKKFNVYYEKQVKFSYLHKTFDFEISFPTTKVFLQVCFYNVSGSKLISKINEYQKILNDLEKLGKQCFFIIDGLGIKTSHVWKTFWFDNYQKVFTLFSFEKYLRGFFLKK